MTKPYFKQCITPAETGKKAYRFSQAFLASPFIAMLLMASACSPDNRESSDEHIRVLTSASDTSMTDTLNSIRGNLSLNQIPSDPNMVVLTGMPQHRLVTIYKKTPDEKISRDYSSYDYDHEGESERVPFFMPGIDLIYGYNLLNIAHYDMTSGSLNFLFAQPVLVKSLYYPSYVQDSLFKKPINRDYYLVSAYDADTNQDTLINKFDLRRFYHFNAGGANKMQLIPPDYSVVRSQYDPKNDAMYVFARQDTNKDGTTEKKEPIHIFWFSLRSPAIAKRLY